MAVPCRTAAFEGPVARYKSSARAERGFCATCGTALFFHVIEPDIYGVSRDLFDDAADLPFAAEIFVDEKPDLYAFAGERKMMTGAQFAAKFQ